MTNLNRNEIVVVRRALMNYIGLIDNGMLSGQQDPDNSLWTEDYASIEMALAKRLLNCELFSVPEDD